MAQPMTPAEIAAEMESALAFERRTLRDLQTSTMIKISSRDFVVQQTERRIAALEVVVGDYRNRAALMAAAAQCGPLAVVAGGRSA